MPFIAYKEHKFQRDSLLIIKAAKKICLEYSADGYSVTLRQLYYQFVANDLFPDEWTWTLAGKKWIRDPNGTKNAEPNYDRLGSIVNDARLAGMLAWNWIEDRTRNLAYQSTWDSPKDILNATAKQFRYDRWDSQPVRIEVWVEKEALAGVVERSAFKYRCAWFACRGYVSQSEMWNAGQRLAGYCHRGQQVKVLYLGDHDPSGIDMTRDIEDRLRTFSEDADIEVVRLALNMDQVRHYAPPPNPAKVTDSRAQSYISRFGNESWELDALSPVVLDGLISTEIEEHIDQERWDEAIDREDRARAKIAAMAKKWNDA